MRGQIPQRENAVAESERELANGRLFAIHGIESGFMGNSKVAVMAAKHRSRATHLWGEDAPKPSSTSTLPEDAAKEAAKDIARIHEIAEKINNKDAIVRNVKRAQKLSEQLPSLVAHLPSALDSAAVNKNILLRMY